MKGKESKKRCLLTVIAIGCFLLNGCQAQKQRDMATMEMSESEVVHSVGEGTNREETALDVAEEASKEEAALDVAEEASKEEATLDVAEETSKEEAAFGDEDENSRENPAPSLSLIMVGDILLHTPVEESALQADGSYDFTAIFSETKELIQAADLALVNQEVIIGGEELGVSGYPAFNAPYAIGDALAEAGFDVVCHGTNHAIDKGKKGLMNCLSFWEEYYPDMAILGIHDSQESQDNIYIYEQDGIRIAILNYTYGTNGIALPSDMPYGVDLLEQEKVVADIAKAEEAADFTIVCPHWGTEYQLGISSMQEKWTDIFLQSGVDLVLGTHPHVIEPIEWVRDEESGHEMLVYYSLGNFVNWTSGTGDGVANRMVGGMAQVTLEKNNTGEVSIAEYGVEPLVCHLEEGRNGVKVYCLKDYAAKLAEKNEIIQQDAAFSLQYCQDLCQKVWGDILLLTK